MPLFLDMRFFRVRPAVSPIVWAREMDAARNAKLLDYFHDRHVWLLEPDRDLLKLTDYPK